MKTYDIKRRIKRRRQQLGLTLEEVANKVGVSKSTVKRWEDNDIDMTRDKIDSLSKVLEISPLMLIGVEEEPQHNFETFQYKDGRVAVLFDKTKDLTEEDIKQITDYIDLIRKSKGLD